jgi:hypothetical protein
VIGVRLFSPARRYSRDGRPTYLPYRGWKRWHAFMGLTAGVVTVTWAFSGWLSMGPFASIERVEAWLWPAESAAETDATSEAVVRLATVLRGGRLPFARYDAKPPAAAIGAVRGFAVKELEYTSIGGRPVYVASDTTGDTRIIPVDGEPIVMLEPQELMARIRTAVGPRASIDRLDRYDAHYRGRRGERPLPVVRVRFNDTSGTRYYVDPRTASVVSDARGADWIDRWAYHGLHSLDFPWLYNNRPLWDGIVAALLLAGTALSATSLVLAWKALTRRLTSSPPR